MVEYYDVEWIPKGGSGSGSVIFKKKTLKDVIDLIIKHDYDKIIIEVWK